MTNISMEWTNTGAVVTSSIPIACPRCGELCGLGIEHRCGDKLPGIDQKKPKRRTTRGVAKQPG